MNFIPIFANAIVEKWIFNWKNGRMPNTKNQMWNRFIHKTKISDTKNNKKRTKCKQTGKNLNTSISSFIRQDGTNGNCLSWEWPNRNKKKHRVVLSRVAKQKINFALFIEIVEKTAIPTNDERQQQKNRGQRSRKIQSKIECYFLSLTKNVCQLHFFVSIFVSFVVLFYFLWFAYGPNGHIVQAIVRYTIDRGKWNDNNKKYTNKHAKRTALEWKTLNSYAEWSEIETMN